MREESALVHVGDWLQENNYRFVTVTPATHARVIARLSSPEARSVRDVFGWSRPFHPALLPARVLAWLYHADSLSEDNGLLRCNVRYSTLGDRLYLHSAFPTVDADTVFFGPDTYRFCALIRQTLAQSGDSAIARVLDVGCGSGAGGIEAAALLSRRPPQLILADINTVALRHARVNVALSKTANVSFREGDLFHVINRPVDLMVANPPYLLDPGARLYRNGGGEFGAGLSTRIVAEGVPRLAPGGTLILYTGTAVVEGRDTFLQSIQPLLNTMDVEYDYTELDPDVFGEELDCAGYAAVERIAAVGLVVRQRQVALPAAAGARKARVLPLPPEL